MYTRSRAFCTTSRRASSMEFLMSTRRAESRAVAEFAAWADDDDDDDDDDGEVVMMLSSS